MRISRTFFQIPQLQAQEKAVPKWTTSKNVNRYVVNEPRSVAATRAASSSLPSIVEQETYPGTVIITPENDMATYGDGGLWSYKYETRWLLALEQFLTFRWQTVFLIFVCLTQTCHLKKFYFKVKEVKIKLSFQVFMTINTILTASVYFTMLLNVLKKYGWYYFSYIYQVVYIPYNT